MNKVATVLIMNALIWGAVIIGTSAYLSGVEAKAAVVTLEGVGAGLSLIFSAAILRKVFTDTEPESEIEPEKMTDEPEA